MYRKTFKLGSGRFFRDKLNSSQNVAVLTIGAGINILKSRENFVYDHGHDILRFFVTLPHFLFTTSETKRDY